MSMLSRVRRHLGWKLFLSYLVIILVGVLPPDAATFQQVYREADRLQRLISDLQELSRVEAGAFELNLQPTLVLDLVESVAARLGRQFEEKSVALETEVSANLPSVCADEDRIGQVLLNLVGNALQYTPAGGGSGCAPARRETPCA